jgi:hypothetical protein
MVASHSRAEKMVNLVKNVRIGCVISQTK